MTDRPTTRFAPSHTGYLHLGHVANAVWTWDTAARLKADVILRMEDHDRTRCRPEYELQVYDDLEWLGFTPTAESLQGLRAGASPFRQSDSEEHYLAALRTLEAEGLVYGCSCSRSDIARELGDGLVEGQELRYPGTCRDRGLEPGPGVGARIRLPDNNVSFDDLLLGHQHQRPHVQCGDLLARDRQGHWTYQFAVVVDDLRHQITHVVRGADLIDSTPWQLRIGAALGVPTLTYAHVPLVTEPDGSKLAKSRRAPAVADMPPGAALVLALRLLGYEPSGDLVDQSPARILDWALAGWPPRALGGRKSVALPG